MAEMIEKIKADNGGEVIRLAFGDVPPPTAYIHILLNIEDSRRTIQCARDSGIENVREVVIEVDGLHHEMSLDEFIRKVVVG